MKTTAKKEECGPRHELLSPTWLFWASAAMVGELLVLAGVEFHHAVAEQEPAPPWIATSEEVARFAPDAGMGRKRSPASRKRPGQRCPSTA